MKRWRRRPISSINVVPYLDVLLVLLVIFMITAPLFNQGVIDLPTVGKEALPQAKESTLEIRYQNRNQMPYRLVDHREGVESPRLSQDELMTELGKKEVLYGKTQYIIIAAEGGLSYRNVIELLGVLRDAGYTNIALAAKNE